MSCLSVREPRHFQVSEREAMLVPLDAHGSVMSTCREKGMVPSVGEGSVGRSP